MNRIYCVIWNCTLQVFQACSELTRRVGKTSTVNLRKSSGLTTKFSRLTLGVLLALSGSVSGASLEVDNGQITNIDTDVAYDAYLVGWYGTGVLNILAGGNAALTTITTSVIGGNEDSEGTVNVLGGTWRLYDSGNNARPLNVGQSGTGTLNIKQKGHVDGGYLRLGTQTAGVGTVNVEGEDSVLTTELFEIGSYGTGSLNITDKGYVTSSIVAILGYQAGSNGQVVVEKGGEWLIKNNDSSIEFQIGNQGTGEATIREGGLVTAENTIIGGNATGIGTLNVQDQDSVITVRRLYNGYFGNGTVNISNNGLINNKEYSLVGVQDGSHGVVNVTDKGHWNFLGTGEAFRYIYIGDAGDGELNVSSEGKVDSGIITAGMKETGTGNITVKDKNSVITNLGTNLGYDGHGEMNISNQGLVVSNGGSSLGYGETGVGNVSITTGGMWEVNKNVYTTIGVAGGHAKNFSVFIQAGGSYRLTPFYDIISAFLVLGGTGIHISDLKLAMGLNASKGKKTAIDKIYPRHFLATAKVLRFPEVQMHEILSDFARMIPAALDNVKTSLPTDFPENVVTAVESNVLRLHGRLSREYGSK
ncbi:ESPR-type extended signal peptide-containing protein [Escherichia coli]